MRGVKPLSCGWRGMMQGVESPNRMMGVMRKSSWWMRAGRYLSGGRFVECGSGF